MINDQLAQSLETYLRTVVLPCRSKSEGSSQVVAFSVRDFMSYHLRTETKLRDLPEPLNVINDWLSLNEVAERIGGLFMLCTFEKGIMLAIRLDKMHSLTNLVDPRELVVTKTDMSSAPNLKHPSKEEVKGMAQSIYDHAIAKATSTQQSYSFNLHEAVHELTQTTWEEYAVGTRIMLGRYMSSLAGKDARFSETRTTSGPPVWTVTP